MARSLATSRSYKEGSRQPRAMARRREGASVATQPYRGPRQSRKGQGGIFVSYASDAPPAAARVGGMKRHGWAEWWDQEIAPVRYPERGKEGYVRRGACGRLRLI